MSDFFAGFQQVISPSLSQLGGEEGAYDSDGGLVLRSVHITRSQLGNC